MGILSKHADKGFKVLKKKEEQNKTLELCAMFSGCLLCKTTSLRELYGKLPERRFQGSSTNSFVGQIRID